MTHSEFQQLQVALLRVKEDVRIFLRTGAFICGKVGYPSKPDIVTLHTSDSSIAQVHIESIEAVDHLNMQKEMP